MAHLLRGLSERHHTRQLARCEVRAVEIKSLPDCTNMRNLVRGTANATKANYQSQEFGANDRFAADATIRRCGREGRIWGRLQRFQRGPANGRNRRNLDARVLVG